MKKLLFILSIFLLFSCIEEEIVPESNIPKPIYGMNYYQLHQFDFDGNSEKHPIFATQVKTYHNQGGSSSGRIAASTYSSLTNGDWEDSDTWDLGIPDLEKNTTVIISDTVYAQSLNFKKGGSITVQAPGVLIIENLTLAKDFILDIQSGAGMIVTGNISGKKDSNVTISGILSVGGNVEFGSGTTITNTSDSVYICGTTNTTVGTNTEKNCTDLLNENPDFYDATVLGTALPITLLYQCAKYDPELYGIFIEWETATEVNSDYVVVMWSDSGYNWHPIDTVYSNNEPSKYSTVHSF